MAEISRPELCVVGAGALGIALAKHARRLGASVMLVDRGFPEPGDGPQRALRLASLVASAAAAADTRNAVQLGLGAVEPKISMKAVQERARQLSEAGAVADSHERLVALGIDVLSGPARFVDSSVITVGERQIRPQAFVLAVGGNVMIPAIPGLEEAGYFTPDTILENTRKLTHLLVIGADADALVLAQVFARLGSDVTVVPQGAALAGFDMETASILLQTLAEDGVRVIDGAKVSAIQPRSQGIGASVELSDGSIEALDLSHVLVANGLEPYWEGLNAESARLRPLRGQEGRFDAGTLGQTSNSRIRVVGIAAGVAQWQHALSQGRAVVEALVLGAPRRRPGAMPRVVSTQPTLAQIGRMPQDGKPLPSGHGVSRANLAENDMARAEGRGAGLIKVITGAKGQIVGASIVGAGAAEMAGHLALIMDQGLPLDAFADLPLPNPSLMASLVELGEIRASGRAVSTLAKRRGALRRRLGL